MNALVRDLKLARPSGVVTVPVTIHSPVQRALHWECAYEIGWPEGIATYRSGGADAVQAVYLAMQALAVSLYASEHHKSGNLYWEAPGQGYGFPMPKVGRENLVGEDRLYQL